MPIKDDSLETYGRKHPVPQNVMDVEFKIVGDLTIRQFMYLVVGGLLLFVVYKSHLPSFWMWVLLFIITVISVAVAFVPIEDRGMDVWLSNFVKSMKKPAQRVWQKTEVMPTYFLLDYSQNLKTNYTLTPIKNKNKLEDFLGQLNKGVDHDAIESERLEQINQIMMSDATSSFVKDGQQKAIQHTKIKHTETKQKIDKADIIVDEINAKQSILSSISKPTLTSNVPQRKDIDRPLVNIPQELKRQRVTKTKKKKRKTTPVKQTTTQITRTGLQQSDKEKQGNKIPTPPRYISQQPMVKELEEHKISLEKQVKELKETTEKAKQEFLNKPQERRNKLHKIELFNRKLFELKTEREKLDFKIHRRSKDVSHKKETKQLEELKLQNKMLEKQLEAIKKDLESIKDGKPQNDGKSTMIKPNQTTNQNTPQEEPNIVRGIVKDSDGKLLESAVIIIKDKNGDVVRALKSNGLGEFRAQTPIENGVYTIEVIKSGRNFDILSIKLEGKPFEPVTLTAKQ